MMENRKENEVTPLHYALVREYKEQQYEGVLTNSDVSSDMININTITLPDGREVKKYGFWGYELKKDQKRYLLGVIDSNNKEISIGELLPIYPEGLRLISHKGNAYSIIEEPIPARIEPERKLNFRQIIDRLNDIKSTNPTHRKLFIIDSVLKKITRLNTRVCSNFGFGKDSVIDILDATVGSCGSVANPSVAKLEYMAYLHSLTINEVSNIKESDWDAVQQFLLDVGAMKNHIYKRTRKSSGVGEIIDIHNLSIGLFYNDITAYKDLDKFFENKADDNVTDRFIPFKFYGVYKEDFSLINNVDVKEYVKENFLYYRYLTASILYYNEHFLDELKVYESPNISSYPDRWKQNLKILFNGINLYSDTQEEYTSLCKELIRCISDYTAMLSFPTNYGLLLDKLEVPESIKDKGCRFIRTGDKMTTEAFKYFISISEDKGQKDDVREVARQKAKFLMAVVNEPLFLNKNVLCLTYISSSCKGCW